MTEAEIIEGNKLIAEFMEYEHCTDPDHASNKCYSVPYAKGYHRLNQMQHHSSWDWLMPVVEKINTISIQNYGEMGVYIKPFTCYIGSDETDPVIITTFGNYPKLIEMVWSAVVTFIRWYNQNQSNKP